MFILKHNQTVRYNYKMSCEVYLSYTGTVIIRYKVEDALEKGIINPGVEKGVRSYCVR